MATLNAVGVSMGLAPPENGPTAVRAILDFTTQLSQRYDGLAGDGSARGKYGYQTAFIDNGKNADALQVVCDGTLLEFTVPPKSQAFLPIACPPGMLGLTFTMPNLGATVPVMLFDTPTPYAVWSVAAPASGAADSANTKFGIGGGLSSTRVTVGTVPIIVTPSGAAFNVLRLRNSGTESVFLGAASVTTSNGFELPAGATFEISGVKPSTSCYAISVNGGQQVARIQW